MLIKKRHGKKKGKHGLTIHIFQQYSKPMISKSLTVHGLNIEQCFENIKFWLRLLERAKKLEIYIEED